MKRYLLVLLLLWLPFAVLRAENLDSLEHILRDKGSSAPDRISACDKLSWELLDTDFQRACSLANAGLALAKKEDNDLMTGRLYRNLGVAYTWEGKRDSAHMYLQQALRYAQKAGNESLEASVYGATGNIYLMENRSEKAIEWLFKALEIFEKNNQTPQILEVIGNIGTLYIHIGNYAQAEVYLLRTETLCIQAGDSIGVGVAADGLVSVYMNKGELDKAVCYGLRAARIFHDLGLTANEATALQSVSHVYREGYKDYAKAAEYARQSLALARQVGYPAEIIAALNALSGAQLHTGEYAESERNAMEALEMDSSSIVKRNLLHTLMAANIMLGRKGEALEFFRQYDTYVSGIADEAFQKQLSEMEVQYQTNKKEARIEALQKERGLIIWLSLAAAGLALLAIALLIVRHRLAVQRNKLAEAQLEKLEQEQQLVAAQAVMDGETAERTRLARDLHDGLGGMLSAVKINLRDAGDPEKARQMLDQSIRELHRVAHHMMPDMLLRYGLKTSLEEFCASIPTAEFHYFGAESRLDNRLEVLLYRCTHELVNNAVKHANAKHIYVQLVRDAERIALTVQDDGVGFDPETTPRGMGLENLRNRISVFHGRMEIFSSTESGTEVFIEIPSV